MLKFKTAVVEGEVIEIGVSTDDKHGRNYHHIKIEQQDGTVSTIPDLSVSFNMSPNIAINNFVKIGIAGRKGSYYAVAILSHGILSCQHIPRMIIIRFILWISFIPLIITTIEHGPASILFWFFWLIFGMLAWTRRLMIKAKKQISKEITAGEIFKREVVY